MAVVFQIPGDLIRRLPATFGPALKDQVRRWDYLFAAERKQLQAQVAWLSKLPVPEFKQLFDPLFDIEHRMALPKWDSRAAGLSVHDVGVLARSPLYPQWRAEVERVFAKIDASAERQGDAGSLRRLVLCVLPPGVPLKDQTLWPGLSAEGRWLALDRPFGRVLPEFVAAIASRKCPEALEPDERTWVFECNARFSGLAGAAVLSWAELSMLRREFLRRLNAVRRDLHSVDQTSEELRQIEIDRLVNPAIAASPRLREFVRSLLLSGNGALVFSNSFVEWGASEAFRRAQPQALITVFGVRPKLKPYSSVVLFEDQSRSNPAPDEDDPAGSLVDALMLSEYVHLAAQRFAPRPDRTLTLMAASELDRLLALCPAKTALPAAPATPESLSAFALNWLAS